MTITESHPSDLIGIKLDFLRPFEATISPCRADTAVNCNEGDRS
jgi:hypothetical protein